MSWIKTIQKPKKICIENPDFPLFSVFSGYNWKLSGGTKQAGILAAAFICAANCQTVVEIGTWQGFTSAILGKSLSANAGSDGLLISVDIKEGNLERGKAETKNLPITHKTVVCDSVNLDLGSELGGRVIDLAFVDGDHSYDYAKNDIELCHEHLRDYGFIFVHDYSKTGFPGVYRAVNEFVETFDYSLFFLDENRVSTDYRTAILQRMGNY
jgi:predicted O-methyltransferase YrrM